jgi:uncharacterized protein (DUF427 family)
MKAIWNGATLAESDQGIVVEGNYYFPPDAVNGVHLRESQKHTTCFWKSVASYDDVDANGKVNKNAAWYYPEPSEAARQIKGYIAFWHSVKVVDAR